MSNSSKPIARFLCKFFSWLVIVAFWLNTVLPAYAQTVAEFSLPAVGEQVALSQNFTPLLLKAVKVHPDNPFQFDFIVHEGSSKLQDDQLKSESQKLIRYFLAALTTPENDLWVNLSPYEKNRIIPQSLGTTEMGRDLLGEDYLLKQITATLLYPEGELGKKFWDSTGARSIVPLQSFNKVWIVPQKAVVYENGATAYVDETYLKVMLEEDLTPPNPLFKKAGESEVMQLTPSLDKEGEGGVLSPNISLQIFRSIILPELEKEVNEGKNFAPLRQIYNSLILANWYKKRLKDSILSQVYVDKNKVAGIDLDDKEQAQKIYAQYVEAFKKGVYNYIKEDYDPLTQETLPRKYFSGGMGLVTSSAVTEYRKGLPKKVGVASSNLLEITVNLDFSNGQSPVKKASSPAGASTAVKYHKDKAMARGQRVREVFKSFPDLLKGLALDYKYYGDSKSLTHRTLRGVVSTFEQPLLPKFIDEVFTKALALGNPQETQIVFLEAGAKPLFDAAQMMAEVSGIFPTENLKSVWATNGNYQAMKDDEDQKLLFIKYLYDQRVLTPQTKHLLIVDTDAGIGVLGTASIFAKTLLDNEIIKKANGGRFKDDNGNPLNIGLFNEKGSENTADFFYMYCDYHREPKNWFQDIAKETISPQVEDKLRIQGYNDGHWWYPESAEYYTARLWHPVDMDFIKTTSIANYFSLDNQGRAVVTLEPPTKQPYDNSKILNLLRAVQDIGLLMGVLDVLEGRGFDVTKEADQLIANLEKALRTSGVTQVDIDASKPQPGYTASSSLIPVSSAENIGVASSNLFEIDVNLNLAQTGVSSLPNNVIQPEDKRSQINIINAEKRWESVQLLFKQFFSDGFYKLKYKFSRALAYKLKWREGENTAILLPQFIDEVFRRALRLGDVQSTKIVFLKAGAQPLYDAAQLMAKVSGVFPKENLKSVWATMNNYRAMKADPEQAVLFIGYLFEQGVLTSETKHLLIVDTDTGLGTAGTELIFAETLLNNDVINKANLRFGLNIARFNEEGSENSLDLFYMTAQYDRTPGLFNHYMNYEEVGSRIRDKLRISGFPTEVSVGYKITKEIADLWSPVDRFVKTENIEDRFTLNSEGRVIVKPLPPVKQFSKDIQDLILARISEDTGLLMGVLDVLEGRGFDVTKEADQLIANLEKALKTSGVTQVDIDASKPQPGYTASSSLTDISPAGNVNNLGGIDLTAGKTPLDIRGQGQPVEFNFDLKQLQNLQFEGLVPVIINIVPVVNLPLFLTEKPVSKPTPQLSRSN